MSDFYTQRLPRVGTLLVGATVLTVGTLTAAFTLFLGASVVRNTKEFHSSFPVVLVLVLASIFAVVLITAGVRLLFTPSAASNTLLPRSLWLILCPVFAALALIGLFASLFAKPSNSAIFFSGLWMAGFSWWCYRFGRPGKQQLPQDAASNPRLERP
jgi:hypothetical protein